MLALKTLKETLPELDAIIKITDEGNLLDYDVSRSFMNEMDFESMKYITDLVSLRFRIGEFSQLFGGLKSTINNFKDKIMVSRSLKNDNIMILILPANTNLEELNQILYDI
ncbi:MAG: hypothetical protein O6761_06785 [Thaumarchaeota archaeon]|nr:hypothetical protein [Nitrososphaerota archaeon]